MPVVLGETPPLVPEAPRKRWTRTEVELLENSCAFEGQHYELVGGDLINKMGKKRPHYSAVAYSGSCLRALFGEGLVLQETPIDVAPEDNPTSEPEPDVIVLTRPLKEIPGNHIQPFDVVLVLEVSDSTLRLDLATKAGLYARASLSEYWVLDVNGARLIVHRDPQ